MALVPFRPNPTQAKFIYSTETYTAMYGGVGNGKSAAGCTKMQMLLDMYDGNIGLVGRLTYPELRDTSMADFLAIARIRNGGTLDEGPYIKSWNKTEHLLTLQNGSVCMFRYLENDESILSLQLGAFWIDQAEFVPEKTYLALESRLRLWGPDERDPAYPDIPTKKEEWAARYEQKYGHKPASMPREFGFITGNPGPGWVYERYKRNPSGLYEMHEASTRENRSNLPSGYEERLRASYSEDYVRRFVDGDWSVLAGAVYKDYSSGLHLVAPEETTFWDADEKRLNIPAYYPRILGWDHGQRNQTAMEGYAVDEDGNFIVYLEHYKVSSILSDHANAVKALLDGEPVERAPSGHIVVHMDPSVAGTSDPNTGRDFRQLYQDHGIIGLVASKNVNAGIGKIEYLLRPDPTHLFPKWHPRAGEPGAPRMFIMRGMCPGLEHEFPLYQWEQNRTSRQVNEVERPRKYLDHALDALRYAVMAWFNQVAKKPHSMRIPTYDEYVLKTILNDGKGDGPW